MQHLLYHNSHSLIFFTIHPIKPIEITNFYLDKHFHEEYFNKNKLFCSYIFLPWKIFKDVLKILTSSKRLIQVDCWLYFCYFDQNLPSNINNLSGAAILIFRRYFRSSCPSTFYEIGVIKSFAKFLGKRLCQTLFPIKL